MHGKNLDGIHTQKWILVHFVAKTFGLLVSVYPNAVASVLYFLLSSSKPFSKTIEGQGFIVRNKGMQSVG